MELVATDPRWQGRGYASCTLAHLVAGLPASYELAALSPATRGIYQRLGWVLWQGPLAIRSRDGTLVPTPDEELMVLPLPASPTLDLNAPMSAEWRPGEVW